MQERATVAFIPQADGGVRVVFYGAYVTNPGTAFEQQTASNGSALDEPKVQAFGQQVDMACSHAPGAGSWPSSSSATVAPAASAPASVYVPPSSSSGATVFAGCKFANGTTTALTADQCKAQGGTTF